MAQKKEKGLGPDEYYYPEFDSKELIHMIEEIDYLLSIPPGLHDGTEQRKIDVDEMEKIREQLNDILFNFTPIYSLFELKRVAFRQKYVANDVDELEYYNYLITPINKEKRNKEKHEQIELATLTDAFRHRFSCNKEIDFAEILFNFLIGSRFIEKSTDKTVLSKLISLEAVSYKKSIIWIDKAKTQKNTTKILTRLIMSLFHLNLTTSLRTLKYYHLISAYFKLPDGPISVKSLQTHITNFNSPVSTSDREDEVTHFLTSHGLQLPANFRKRK